MHCLGIPQFEKNRYKVQKGRSVHALREKQNAEYLRKRIGCVRKETAVPLSSKSLGVRGIVDEVLFLSDGTASPLDYKYSECPKKPFSTHRAQIVLCAMLIEEVYAVRVERGFLCYVRGGYRVKEVGITSTDTAIIGETLTEMRRIIISGEFPAALHDGSRCLDCCYRNICEGTYCDENINSHVMIEGMSL